MRPTRTVHPLPAGFLTTELINGITHGIGFALSNVGLVVLVAMAAVRGSARHVVACSIYGATLVLLYAASTLYHSVWAPRVKQVLRIIDHIAIFLLIAGTYTPFTLISMSGGWGWSLFGTVWGLALVGSLMKVFFTGRFGVVSVLIYLGMGWLAILGVKPLLQSLTVGGFLWLAAGGLAYTFGLVFYAWERLPFHHAIWHVFVMLGSACHFFAVMFYVLPPAA